MKNNIKELLIQIHNSPETVAFNDVIDVIDSNYRYTPVRFSNGPVDERAGDGLINNAGENEGSCKIFSFAQLHQLSKIETLQCFGVYYRDDVLKHPENNDHAIIRNFIKYGWSDIRFEKSALDEPQPE